MSRLIQTYACGGQYQLQIKTAILNLHAHTLAHLYVVRS